MAFLKRFSIAAAALFMATLLGPSSTLAQSEDGVIRSLVHVLDYMAADYAVAVENGEIVNEAEYAEMENFAANAAHLIGEIDETGRFTSGRELRSAADRLMELVAEKAEPETVESAARAMRDAVIEQTGIVTTPRSWPNLADGAAIYAQQCSQCHGGSGGGDGPAAAGLEPAPTVFSEGERIASISPFQAYNTIRLGVDGTSMLAYSELTDREVWELAFYVKSLRAGGPDAQAAENVPSVDSLAAVAPLELVAASNDFELASVLERAGISRPEAA
ncbi:MAG: c-type cytochrome, partial [Rhodothermales bacterium]|nr:c-type cytochrome [Rhodothermales bacterium]